MRKSRRTGIAEISRSNNFVIYIGAKCNNKNKSGILMTMITENSVAFLTGDHTNHQVWGEQYHSSYNSQKELNVVVPHHGGCCGKLMIPSGNNGKAAISVGKNNYGHPNDNVISIYKKAGFDALRTDKIADDIIIDLN